MTLWRFSLLVSCLFFSTEPLLAQTDEARALKREVPSESGAAYLKAIEGRWIDADVEFYEPNGPTPSLKTSYRPQKEEKEALEENTSSGTRMSSTIISVAVLLIILFLFIRFGGGLSVSLSRDMSNAKSTRKGKAVDPLKQNVETVGLHAILQIADRRQALILLAQSALVKVLSSGGVLVQDSWTSRDALMRVPRDHNYFQSLRSLVMASELVQFGGRDMSEEEFQSHVGNMRPLIEGHIS